MVNYHITYAPAIYEYSRYKLRENAQCPGLNSSRANTQQQKKDGPQKEYTRNYGGDPMEQLLKTTLTYTYVVLGIVLTLFYAMQKQVEYEKKQRGEPIKKGLDDGLDFMSRYTINAMSRSQLHNRDELRERLKERYLELKENSKK